MEETKKLRVLFVCLGNICRSPMAEAVFRHLVQEAGLANQIDVESAGTGNWHAGEPSHRGTLDVLRRHQIDGSKKRARALTRSDFEAFDYIVAMDEENVSDILTVYRQRVSRLLEYAAVPGSLDVPDPYYTGNFDLVYRLVADGAQGLLAHIRAQEGI